MNIQKQNLKLKKVLEKQLFNNRIEELDIIKGVGIILIVLGHLEPGIYLMKYLYSFHLFLFFVCSGFIGVRYEKRKIVEILKGNIKRLLLPYIFWGLISQSIDFFVGKIDLYQAVSNILFLNGNVGWNAALWFLVSLFWADNICAIIVKANKVLQCIIGFLLVVLWFIVANFNLTLPFGLYTFPMAAFFWLVGYWINSFDIYLIVQKSNIYIKIVSMFILLVINTACGVIFNDVISIYHIKYNNIILSIISGVSGVFFWLIFALLIKNNQAKNIIVFYGKNTLAILCTHYFILRLFGVLTQLLVGHDLWRYTSTIKSLIVTLVVIVMYYPVIIMLNKWKHKITALRYLL